MSDVIYPRDYSLLGRDAARAEEIGLSKAQWYAAPIPRAMLRTPPCSRPS